VFCQVVRMRNMPAGVLLKATNKLGSLLTSVMEATAMDSMCREKTWPIKRTQTQNLCTFFIFSWLRTIIPDDYAFSALHLLWYPTEDAHCLFIVSVMDSPFRSH